MAYSLSDKLLQLLLSFTLIWYSKVKCLWATNSRNPTVRCMKLLTSKLLILQNYCSCTFCRFVICEIPVEWFRTLGRRWLFVHFPNLEMNSSCLVVHKVLFRRMLIHGDIFVTIWVNEFDFKDMLFHVLMSGIYLASFVVFQEKYETVVREKYEQWYCE